MCHPTELANTLQLSAITECGFRKADQRGGYVCRADTFTQDRYLHWSRAEGEQENVSSVIGVFFFYYYFNFLCASMAKKVGHGDSLGASF